MTVEIFADVWNVSPGGGYKAKFFYIFVDKGCAKSVCAADGMVRKKKLFGYSREYRQDTESTILLFFEIASVKVV